MTNSGNIVCLICKAINPRLGKPLKKKSIGQHIKSRQHIDAVQSQSQSQPQESAASSSVHSHTSTLKAQLLPIQAFPPVQTGPSTIQPSVSKVLQGIYMEDNSYFYSDGTEIQFSAGESSSNTLQQNLALQLQQLKHLNHTVYAQELQLPHDPEDSGVGSATESNVMQALYDMGLYL
jgi:hypothetical protein